jgi:diguanylate cyclase (GGDEF)-like protein
MDDILNSVGDLTDARDKDALELTLASVMFELVGAARLNLWRVINHEDGLKLRWRVRLDNSRDFARDIEARQTGTYGRPARQPPSLGAPFELADHFLDEIPSLESRSELHSCYLSKLYMRWPADGEGLCRHVFPVLDGRDVISIVEILRAAPLTEDQERLVFGMLRIYRNHLGMLDYSDCDDLTGLLNRRTFDETFKRVAGRLATPNSSGPRVSDPHALRQSFIAVVDIDNFKRVNDQFGHPYGDEVLVLLARIMSRLFDDSQFLFRFGGEEFVVILVNSTLEAAWETFERLRTTVENFAFPQVGRVTVSIGMSKILPGDAGSNAFGRADQALYYSKRNGRNQLHSFDELVASGKVEVPPSVAHEVEMF